MKERQIKFICKVVKWFDKVNGNTYHSIRITRTKDGKTIVHPYKWVYGYGSAYEDTALQLMLDNKWLPKKYNKDNLYYYQRENNYPIYFDVEQGLKREMIANGTL